MREPAARKPAPENNATPSLNSDAVRPTSATAGPKSAARHCRLSLWPRPNNVHPHRDAPEPWRGLAIRALAKRRPRLGPSSQGSAAMSVTSLPACLPIAEIPGTEDWDPARRRQPTPTGSPLLRTPDAVASAPREIRRGAPRTLPAGNPPPLAEWASPPDLPTLLGLATRLLRALHTGGGVPAAWLTASVTISSTGRKPKPVAPAQGHRSCRPATYSRRCHGRGAADHPPAGAA
jgi:hypothetical protein